jgi:hypothetical protein
MVPVNVAVVGAHFVLLKSYPKLPMSSVPVKRVPSVLVLAVEATKLAWIELGRYLQVLVLLQPEFAGAGSNTLVAVLPGPKATVTLGVGLTVPS